MKFVDSSFWIGLHNPRDAHFRKALSIWIDDRDDLVTTNHVVGETWTFPRRRMGHAIACRFVDLTVSSTRLRVVHVSEATEQEAWAWLRRHDERVYSFVDATSFATMRTLGIFEAFAFDDDFSAAGFVEVRP